MQIRRGGRGWAHPSSPGPPHSNPDKEKETWIICAIRKKHITVWTNTFDDMDKYIWWFGQIQHHMQIRRGGRAWAHPSSPGPPHSNPDEDRGEETFQCFFLLQNSAFQPSTCSQSGKDTHKDEDRRELPRRKWLSPSLISSPHSNPDEEKLSNVFSFSLALPTLTMPKE